MTFSDILQKSFEQTCESIPVLRCKVFTVPPTDGNSATGRLEARRVEGWAPKLVHNDKSDTPGWPDYERILDAGLPQFGLDPRQLLPQEEFTYDLAKTGAPVFVCQANYVTKGLLLGVGIFHSVIDGMSGSLFLKLWARNARALQGVSDAAPMLEMDTNSCDYSIMERIYKSEEEQMPHAWRTHPASPELWRLLGLLPPDAPNEHQQASPGSPPQAVMMESRVFYVSASSFEALAAKCSSDEPESPKVTANDALMALLWRCLIRARATAAGPCRSEYAHEAMATLDTTLDGRDLVGAPLPWSYMGTLILIATTSMSVGDLTRASTSLEAVARTIRGSLNSITRKRVLEAYGLAAGLSDYGPNSLRFPFATLEGAEVCITSWVSLSALDISFGDHCLTNGGRPHYVRPPCREFGSLCRRVVVLPMNISGGFEVLIEMKKEELEALDNDKEFQEYAKFVTR